MAGRDVNILILEQTKARLRALEPVYGPQRQENFGFRAYPLLRAIKKGHVDEFIHAFENYSNGEGVSLSKIVAIRGPSGNTLLHVAAGIENADIRRALLDVIDDEQLVTKENDEGDTALHIAARAGRDDVANLLLDRGIAMDVENKAGNTALHEAVKNGNLDMTDLLLRRGSKSVNKKNKEKKCPLYLAVETGKLEILLRLLEALDEMEVLYPKSEGMSPEREGMSPVLSPESEGMSPEREGMPPVLSPEREGMPPVLSPEREGMSPEREGMSPVLSPESEGMSPQREGMSPVLSPKSEGMSPEREGMSPVLSPESEGMPPFLGPVPPKIEGMSPVHGAVIHKKLDMLKEMSEKKRELFYLEDERGSPLHLAARENYVDGVKFLVDRFTSSAFWHKGNNYLPIHVACKMGHLETFKELLQHWPALEELLTLKCQSVLHVAAMYGRASIVKYILGNPELEKLINAKDELGNTPLHIATMKGQLEILFSLTRDNRVNLELVNHQNFTALDIIDHESTEIDAPLLQRLTRTILLSAGTPKSKDNTSSPIKLTKSTVSPPSKGRLERRAEVLMIVATLIATVTFTAGFSVPGGYNSSKPNAGMAMLLNKPMYEVFVICNSIAMYNSIIAVVILLWTQINDSDVVLRILRMTRLPLLMALATMSMAFMAGVYVTISKRTWLAIVALVVGITALFVILICYITLFIPLRYKCRLVQLFMDYFIRALILISRRASETEADDDNPLISYKAIYRTPPSPRSPSSSRPTSYPRPPLRPINALHLLRSPRLDAVRKKGNLFGPRKMARTQARQIREAELTS